jgi:uncharacterized integral membrane protein
MRLFRGSGRGLDEFQPRLWLIIVGLSAMVLYLLAFIVMNDKQIEIEFVFFTATLSLIWAMVLMVGLGVLGGVLLSQLYRRRRGHDPGEPSDGLS